VAPSTPVAPAEAARAPDGPRHQHHSQPVAHHSKCHRSAAPSPSEKAAQAEKDLTSRSLAGKLLIDATPAD
jgi:hypothetical protein